VSYCQLAGVSSFDRRDIETHSAMGHFEVYQRIIEDKERRSAVREVAARVYPAIAETTDYLVDFNDKYDEFSGSDEDVALLQGDLSKLGEVIAVRGELEDQILAALASK